MAARARSGVAQRGDRLASRLIAERSARNRSAQPAAVTDCRCAIIAACRAAFVERHRQRVAQRLRHRLGIQRVHQDRAGHRLGRTGEGRQHQDARILRVLRRHVFLRHQVHPVAQRRDEPDAR
jgi:hypothetical protein